MVGTHKTFKSIPTKCGKMQCRNGTPMKSTFIGQGFGDQILSNFIT
jgi:hypothetical protein